MLTLLLRLLLMLLLILMMMLNRKADQHSRTLLMVLSRKTDQDSRSTDQKEKNGLPTHPVLMPIAAFELVLYPSHLVTASRSKDYFFNILPPFFTFLTMIRLWFLHCFKPEILPEFVGLSQNLLD